MKIAIANDHSAVQMKNHIKAHLEKKGHTVVNFGTEDETYSDYPIYAARAAHAVANGECDLGIVICGTGIGVSLAANKVKGIRCALCSEPLSAEMTRRHNDANMLALGGGMIGPNMAERIVDVFLSTAFEGGRHQRRVDKVMSIEG